MTDLLFAAPWWLLACLILVGGIVAWTGLTRQQSGARNLGVGLVLLAIILFALGYLFETDKAKVRRQSLELVKSVQDRNWSKFESLLDSDASLDADGMTAYPNRKELMAAAKDKCEQYNLSAVSARVTQVTEDPTGIVVDIDATSRQSATLDYPVVSSWKMDWDRTGSDWHLHQITCLKIGTGTESMGSVGKWIGK